MKWITRSIIIFVSGILLGLSISMFKDNFLAGFSAFIVSLVGFLVGLAGD